MSEEKEIQDIKKPTDTQSHPGAHHNKLLITWKAPDFIPHQKGAKWFIIAGILMLLIITYAIYTGSATMAIVFIVLAGTYYLTRNQAPKIIDIKITELGIFVGTKFYPYNTINSFWIVYHPPFVRTLNLKLSNKTCSRIVIQLDAQNPVEVRKVLAKEIPEIEGGKESTTEVITRMLRL